MCKYFSRQLPFCGICLVRFALIGHKMVTTLEPHLPRIPLPKTTPSRLPFG